jgi:hypothetical protein
MKQLWLIAVLLSACTLGTGYFAGKSCKTNVECPDPYVCAQVRPEGRTCELVRGVETFDPSADNPADYCHDAKPILDKHCVSNCHGTDMSYVGTPRNFRLDVYDTGTALPGAGAKAANINMRTQADTMPPVGLMGYSRPSVEEKGIILRWLNSGAPNCLGDGGTGGMDGGSDAGSSDGGRTDGGDGG